MNETVLNSDYPALMYVKPLTGSRMGDGQMGSASSCPKSITQSTPDHNPMTAKVIEEGEQHQLSCVKFVRK